MLYLELEKCYVCVQILKNLYYDNREKKYGMLVEITFAVI